MGGDTGIVWATGDVLLDYNGISCRAYGLYNGVVQWYMQAEPDQEASRDLVRCHYCNIQQTPADPALCKCCGAPL